MIASQKIEIMEYNIIIGKDFSKLLTTVVSFVKPVLWCFKKTLRFSCIFNLSDYKLSEFKPCLPFTL